MERETGVEPATSSLGINALVESKTLARFCELNRYAVISCARIIRLCIYFGRLANPQRALAGARLPETLDQVIPK